MAITKLKSTGFLIDSVYKKVKEILGTDYVDLVAQSSAVILDLSNYADTAAMLADGWKFSFIGGSRLSRADVTMIDGGTYSITGNPSYAVWNYANTTQYPTNGDLFVAYGTGLTIRTANPTPEPFILSRVVGTALESKTITYVNGFPRNYHTYLDNLPVVFIYYGSRLTPEGYVQGGKRKYPHVINVHVLAGGYTEDSQNELMKQNMLDQLLFGFDQKVYSLYNSYTGAIEGTYNSLATEVPRIITDNNDQIERQHGEVAITATLFIVNT